MCLFCLGGAERRGRPEREPAPQQQGCVQARTWSQAGHPAQTKPQVQVRVASQPESRKEVFDKLFYSKTLVLIVDSNSLNCLFQPGFSDWARENNFTRFSIFRPK